MQMDFQSVDCLQIQARRRQEFNQDFALVFLGSGKSFKVRESRQANNRAIIMGVYCAKLSLGIILTKEGSTVSFILHNVKTTNPLKQLRIQIENNYANSHHLLRVSSDGSTMLFYHESKSDIEIRNFNSLKKRGSLDLFQICNKFKLMERFDQIRVSLDFDSIIHLEKIVLLLANQLILVKKDAIEQGEVLFDCSELSIKERLMALKYNSDHTILFVSGMTSFFLFGFDDSGLSYSRHIACNQFGRTLRLLGWDPKEEFVLIGERIMGNNKENYHLIDYRASEPKTFSLLEEQPFMGSVYDSMNHRLFFIEIGADERKNLIIAHLRDFREKYDSDMEQYHNEVELDISHYSSLPPISEIYTYYLMRSFNGILLLKPVRAVDEKFLKDFPLRM